MIRQFEITLAPFPRGFHLITDLIMNRVKDLPEEGLMHIFIKHTSAGLTISENHDPRVRKDFEAMFNKMVPEDFPYSHDEEGSDDMPSHIKSAMVGSSVSIPITGHRPNLGTWQGIYLCEFRNSGGSRKLLVTVCS